MQTDDTNTNQSASDVDSMLKKSGVEIIDENTDTASVVGPHDSAEKLKHDFETELGSHTQTHTGESGLTTSIRRLEEAKNKLEHEEKLLGDETQKDIEALKKTKAVIEEKITKLKDIEKREKEIETELVEAKELENREKKLTEDATRIAKDTL